MRLQVFPRLDGCTVLVVDDRVEILDLFEDGLHAAGARVLRATCMDEALLLVRTERIDVLISDLQMPMGSGHDLVRAVRRMRHPGKRDVIAIAVTGAGGWDEVDPTMSVRAGFDFHLLKPVMPDALIRQVASMLERRRPESGTLPVVGAPSETEEEAVSGDRRRR
jgi:two-component system CheB/CheR fusion protein